MNKIKTGIELIEAERLEQIFKHERTVDMDVVINQNRELTIAAIGLLDDPSKRPKGWNYEIWQHMTRKPYKERLIIAGALIAAEIDRLSIEEVADGAV